MNKEKTFGAKIGQFLGAVFITCIAACLSAIAIALTVRFIAFLF